MTTYTPIARLPIMTPGDQAVTNAWGAICNAAYSAIEQVAAGVVNIDLTGVSTYTLSTANDAADQARMAFLQFINTPSGTCTVTMPAVARIGWVQNLATTSIILTTGVSGGTTLTVPTGTAFLYYCDGVDVSAVSLLPPGVFSALAGVLIGNNVTYSAKDSGGTARALLGIGSDNNTNLTMGGGTGFQIVGQSGSPTLMYMQPGGGTTYNFALSAVGLLTGQAGVTATGMDANGAHLRATNTSYGVMLRNDNANAYFLQTASGSPTGTWNGYRPFSWSLTTGAVSIDSTGAGVTLGGAENVIGLSTGPGHVPIGGIIDWPGDGRYLPAGWYLCDGQWLSRTTCAALFAVFGTYYGAGDGSTSFAIPDLRGRMTAGLDNMGGTAVNRVTGSSGIAGTTLGAVGGNELLHAHTHGDYGHGHGDSGHAHSDAGHNHGYTTSDFTNGSGPDGAGRSGGATFQGTATGYASISVGYANISTGYANLAVVGSGASQNMPPVMMLNKIIFAGA